MRRTFGAHAEGADMGGADEGVGRDRGAPTNVRSRRIGVLSAPARSRGAEAASCIERGAPGYPSGFEALVDPPRRVYVWGGEWAEPASCAAIVGSRAATPYGLSVAARLARDLAVAGGTVGDRKSKTLKFPVTAP